MAMPVADDATGCSGSVVGLLEDLRGLQRQHIPHPKASETIHLPIRQTESCRPHIYREATNKCW